jgi:hypothetical protein
MSQVNFTNIENTLAKEDSFFGRESLSTINIWVDTLFLPLDRFQSLSETFKAKEKYDFKVLHTTKLKKKFNPNYEKATDKNIIFDRMMPC